jgi:dipeptidyl aminopeptidase/acylaminoacyl peptidase
MAVQCSKPFPSGAAWEYNPLDPETTFMTRMRHVVAALVVCCVVGQPSSGRADDTGWTAGTMLKVKRVSAVTPSPDGRRVAFVVAEAVTEGEKSEWLSHVHLAAADGSASRQLTRGDKSATSPKWSPDGRWVAFLSSRSGKANVWRINPDGGEAEMITDVKVGVTAFDWSPDGTMLALVMRDGKTDEEEKAVKEKRDWRTIDENVKMSRLYVASVEKGADGKHDARVLTSGDFTVVSFDWAPDGRTIVFEHQKTPKADEWASGDISIATVADGTVRPLAATSAAEAEPVWSPDGRWVAYTKSAEPFRWARDFRVHVAAAGGGAVRQLSQTPDNAPNMVGWTSDGTRVLVGETDRLTGRVYAVPVDGTPARALDLGDYSVAPAALNRGGTALGFVAQDSDRAPEPFVVALSERATATQIAKVQPALPALPGRTEVLAWKSKDGRPIEGLLTYPAGYQPGARVPLVLIIHGGPAGVFTRTFVGVSTPYPIAAFAARGFAVLRVNPRGSSGYGVEFRQANLADWGVGDYQDLMTGVDHVIGLGVADGDRLGVMGWSYGGFMTSWVVGQTTRFKAASAGAGVTNLVSFAGTTDIPSFIPNYFHGEFWDRGDVWRKHSPISYVKSVKTPTLLQSGEADDRVPISQSYEYYNALKRLGVTTKFTVYPRQPHGFIEPRMTLDAAQANLDWFERFVKGGPVPTTASR